MKRRPAFLIFVLCTAGAFPIWAAPGRYPITAESVVAALSHSGVSVSPAQVTLLTSVSASVANPELKVKSVDPAGEQRAFARLECTNSSQCLPFIVTLQVAAASAPLSVQSAAHTPRPTTPAVHAGAPAKLLLEGPHVHISISVICLESGAIGQMVRATDHDRHQSYTAQVIREGILEGRL